MSNFTKSKTAKFIGLAVALFMFAGVAAVPVAHALTLSELVELFIALEIIPADKADAARAALAGQTGGTSGDGTTSGTAPSVCPYTWTRSLKVGSTGADVMKLQQFLNSYPAFKLASSGAGSPGNETSYFGSITKAGVVKFQNAYASEVLTPIGLSTGTGYFGTMSIAKANELCATGGTTTDGTTGDTTTPVPSGSGLTVTKHPSQPANMLAPDNAGRVPFTKIQLTASADGAVTVNSITVERQGQASDDSFSGVMLMNEDGTLIGIEKTLNSNHQANVGTAFTIPAGTTKTVIVGANMNADVSGQGGETPSLAVVAVNTSASVFGSLPIVGATHTVNSSLSIGSVTVARGALDPGAGLTKEVGSTEFTFSGFKLTSGSAEDLTLKSVRWYQSGSAAASDLENLVTVVDGTEYPVKNGFGKYYLTVFPGDGIKIKKGFSRDISIKGDIVNGSNRTIDFDIDRRTDIHLVGDLYGYGIRAPLESAAATADSSDFNNADNPYYDASQHTISVGSMQVSSWTVGVPAQNVAENVLDQPIMGLTFDVKGEPISISQIIFTFNINGGDSATNGDGDTSDGIGDITNVVLVDENGVVLAGPADGSGAATDNGTITLSDTIVFPVGITNTVLKAKLGTDFGSNDYLTASTTPNSTNFGTVTGQVTNNTITPSPTSAIDGPTQTVKAGALTISASTQPPPQTVIAGSNQFEFARYILDAGQSGEDLKVTSLQLYFDTDGTRTDLTNCKAYDNGTALNTGGNVLNPSADDTASSTQITFDGAGIVIPKGTTKTLSLKCDVKSGVTSSYWWGVDSGTDITSVSGITSGQTISETIIDANGQAMTAAANGGYTVSTDNSLQYRIAKAGGTDVTIAKLTFEANVEEDVDIKQIAFAMGSTTMNSASELIGEKATVWDGGTKVGDIQFSTGGLNPDNATTTLTQAVRIPRGGSKIITIKGDLRAHDAIYLSNTNEPGAFLQIEYDGDNNGLNGNYANGVDSGQTISGTSSDVAPEGVKIFRGYPTISDVTDTTALVSGAELYKVNVSATGRDVAIARMSFDVLSQGLASIGDFTLVGPNGQVNATARATSDEGNAVTTGGGGASVGAAGRRLTIDFDNTAIDRTIAAGTSKTYRLRLNGPIDSLTNNNTESVSIRLIADTGVATTTGSTAGTGRGRVATFDAVAGNLATGDALMGNVGGPASTTDRFIWSPNSTSTPTESFATKKARPDWTNSYGVPGFPSLGSDMPVRVFSD